MNPSSVIPVAPLPGFLLTETVYPAGTMQAAHEHEDARLIVTIRGGFAETWGRKEHVCRAASALLRPAGEWHSDQFGEAGAVCVGIRFGAKWRAVFEGQHLVGGADGSAEMAPLVRRLSGELGAAGTGGLALQCAVLDIVARFRKGEPSRCERRAPSWIRSTQELLREHLQDPPDLLETARVAGVHPAHLARVFREFTGMSMGTYVRRERIAFACSRLRHSRSPLAEIAQDAGFYDQAHFSRVFRRQMGASPKEFRRQARTS